MKCLQRIWNFLVDHYWLLPIAVVGLFGILSLLILVAVPSRPLMLCVEVLADIFGCLVVLFLVLMFAATFGAFQKTKDVDECIGSLGLNVLALIIGLILQIFAGLSNPDPYAYSHPIPKGIAYNIPIEKDLDNTKYNFRHEAVLESDSTTWLQVSTDFMGRFAYTFYYRNLPAGDVFLRCYEAGTNEPLSAEKVERSTLSPIHAEQGFACQVSDKHLIIYEGAPMQYYVARFEVWHRSADTHKERKLLEKYYRVDGYER